MKQCQYTHQDNFSAQQNIENFLVLSEKTLVYLPSSSELPIKNFKGSLHSYEVQIISSKMNRGFPY